jgi:hypothetical protein
MSRRFEFRIILVSLDSLPSDPQGTGHAMLTEAWPFVKTSGA